MSRISKFTFILIFSLNVLIYGQNNEANGIEIIDLSQTQIRLMNKFENEAIEKRDSILIDSIYKPNQHLWSGYLGDESELRHQFTNIRRRSVKYPAYPGPTGMPHYL